MKLKIRNRGAEYLRTFLERAQRNIATMAQQAANLAGCVIVVNGHLDKIAFDDFGFARSANGACKVLLVEQSIKFCGRYAVLLLAVLVSFLAIGVHSGYDVHVGNSFQLSAMPRAVTAAAWLSDALIIPYCAINRQDYEMVMEQLKVAP